MENGLKLINAPDRHTIKEASSARIKCACGIAFVGDNTVSKWIEHIKEVS